MNIEAAALNTISVVASFKKNKLPLPLGVLYDTSGYSIGAAMSDSADVSGTRGKFTISLLLDGATTPSVNQAIMSKVDPAEAPNAQAVYNFYSGLADGGYTIKVWMVKANVRESKEIHITVKQGKIVDTPPA